MKIISIFLLFLSYIIGAIPFGYLVGRYLKGIDIRDHGSGNIGVANSFRVMGTKYALLVLVGDCLKGSIPVLLAKSVVTEPMVFYLFIGLFAIIGHNWSVFLNFKGGKGIATSYGVVLAFYPYIAIIAALIWGIIVITTKFAALGSIVSIFSMLILSYLFHAPFVFSLFIVFLTLLALVRHRSNITRLLQKKENKIMTDDKKESSK